MSIADSPTEEELGEHREPEPKAYLERIKCDYPAFSTAFDRFTPIFTDEFDHDKPFNPYQAFLELKNGASDHFVFWSSEPNSKPTPSELNDIEFARHESERAEVVVPGELDNIRRNTRTKLAEKLKFFDSYDESEEASDGANEAEDDK